MTWSLPLSRLRLVAIAAVQFCLLLLVGVQVVPPPVSSRPPCADVVAAQVSSRTAVKGSLACLGGGLAYSAAQRGVDTDQSLADHVGQVGRWQYIGQAQNGDYVYEFFHADGSVTSFAFTVRDGKVISAG